MEEERNNQENEVIKVEENMANSSPIKVINEEITINNKSSKNHNTIIGILIVVILLVLGGLVYVLFFMNSDKKDNPAGTPNATEKKYQLNVYKEKEEGNTYTYYGEYGKLIDEKYYGGQVNSIVSFTINVETENAKVLDVYNRWYSEKEGKDAARAYVLYNDNGLFIYDAKNKTSQKIDLDNSYSDYVLMPDEKGSKIIGIAYLKDSGQSGYTDVYDEIGYYNVLKNRKLYDGEYTVLRTNNLENRVTVIDDKYFQIDDMKNGLVVLLSRDEEKVVLSQSTTDGYYTYMCFGEGTQKIYVLERHDYDADIYEEFYNNSMNKFYSRSGKNDLLVDFYNNKLYIIESTANNDNNHIKKFDTSGKLLDDIKKNVEIYDLASGYIIYNKNGMLVIENIDDVTEVKEIDKIVKNFKYDWKYAMFSYDGLKLDYYDTSNKNGMFITVNYKIEDSNGNWGMEYLYEKGKDIVKHPIKEAPGDIGGN